MLEEACISFKGRDPIINFGLCYRPHRVVNPMELVSRPDCGVPNSPWLSVHTCAFKDVRLLSAWLCSNGDPIADSACENHLGPGIGAG